MIANKQFDTLSKFYEIEEYHIDGWKRGAVETPKAKFNHFFKQFDKKIFQLPLRDFEDQKEIDKFLKQIDSLKINESEIKLGKKEIKQFLQFDNVIFASSDFHDWYKDFDPSLHNNIIIFFPISHCEFSGKESTSEYDYLVRYIVDISNWKREISPKIGMKMNNPAINVKTKGKNYLFTTKKNVFIELEKFKDEKAFMELVNWQDEKILIQLHPDKTSFEVTQKETPKAYSFAKLKEYLDRFFCH